MATGLSVSKITRPSIRDILPRKRLFGELDAARDRPIIYVTGPPGSGKTTLVASYLDFKKMPCLWYQVDERDNDISTFFYYMGIAAKKIAPHKKKPLPLFTPEYAMGIPVFTTRFFEELFDRLQKPSVIVLDNYQKVADTAQLHDIISSGLNVIPEKVSVIIISRRVSPRQFVQLRAGNKMNFLSWEELSFTLNEARDFIKMRAKIELSDKTISQIHAKVKGWAAGLILLTEKGSPNYFDHRFVNDSTPNQIFDYFAHEFFEKMDSKTQEFLLKAVFLPKISAPVACALSGMDKAENILQELSNNNFFTTRNLQSDPVYEFHPLFREFLLRNAQSTLPADNIDAIRKSAAELLEAAGSIEDAVELMMAACNWEGLAHVICKHAPSLLSQGRNKTLEEWLNKIPEVVIEKVPWLLYWMGICKMPFDQAASYRYLEKAFQVFEASGDPVGNLLSWAGAVDAILNAWDDFTLLDSWIEWFDCYMKNNPTFPSPYIEVQVTTAMAGALHWRQPQREDVGEWMEKALLFSRQSMNINIRLKIYAHAVNYYNWMGQWSKSKILSDELKTWHESVDASPLILLVYKSIGLASMYYDPIITKA
jgi:LuxR family maltose regulon positive regulatory protein